MFFSRDEFYKKPFGAVAVGQEVFFRIRLPLRLASGCPVFEAFAISDTGGAPLLRLPMSAHGGDGDHVFFCCRFFPDTPGVYMYRFRLTGAPGQPVLSKGADGRAIMGGDGMWQLTVFTGGAERDSFSGCVFYQIFPDRFCRAGGWPENIPAGRMLHSGWYEQPTDAPDSSGAFPCSDYFGGNLEGIRSQLPYLQSLGVQAVYLNPIFEAHSNHRYNTADYMKVDPLLGDTEDFSRLCGDAADRGIRVILDGVFNHTGSDSVYFNREGRYGENTGAWRDPGSPYRGWYGLKAPRSDDYDCWWGFKTLPDVVESDPSYREFICGENGVVRTWLRRGASGWRLDVADELPDDFIRDIRQAALAEKPDALLLGEVWEDASNKYSGGGYREYLLGSELDGVMNYPWRTAILDFVRRGSGPELLEAVASILENYPPMAVERLMCSLSTHDVPRAITALAAPDMAGRGRDWQREHNTLSPEQYYLGRQLFLLASLIQFTLPGCPCIYYGDEAGLVGYADPFNRGTYPWGREDGGLVDFFRLLGQLRKDTPALRRGRFIPVAFDGRCCVYLRRLEGCRDVLTAVNRSDERLALPCPELLDGAEELIHVGSVGPGFSLEGQSGVCAALAAGAARRT